MHARAFAPGSEDVLAAGLDDAGADAQAHGAALGGVGAGHVDRLGDVPQVLLGVEQVDDLDRVGKRHVGDVPDPGRAVADHDLAGSAVEAAPPGLAFDAAGERRRFGVGVAGGGAFDGRRVADRAGLPLGQAPPPRVDRASPDRDQLRLPGPGRAVGLLAGAARQFRPAHRDAGAVHAQVHGRRPAGLGRHDLAFVRRGPAPERLRRALRLSLNCSTSSLFSSPRPSTIRRRPIAMVTRCRRLQGWQLGKQIIAQHLAELTLKVELAKHRPKVPHNHDLERLFKALPARRRNKAESVYSDILRNAVKETYDVLRTVESFLHFLGPKALVEIRYYWDEDAVSNRLGVDFFSNLISPHTYVHLVHALMIAFHDYPTQPLTPRYAIRFISLRDAVKEDEGVPQPGTAMANSQKKLFGPPPWDGGGGTRRSPRSSSTDG